MAEKTRRQWERAASRWTLTGVAVGVIAGVVLGAQDPAASIVDYLSFTMPMGAALIVMLWLSTYRYSLFQVWGTRLALLSMLLMLALVGLGVGVVCLQGACGER